MEVAHPNIVQEHGEEFLRVADLFVSFDGPNFQIGSASICLFVCSLSVHPSKDDKWIGMLLRGSPWLVCCWSGGFLLLLVVLSTVWLGVVCCCHGFSQPFSVHQSQQVGVARPDPRTHQIQEARFDVINVLAQTVSG